MFVRRCRVSHQAELATVLTEAELAQIGGREQIDQFFDALQVHRQHPNL
jgi:hypothetical protein